MNSFYKWQTALVVDENLELKVILTSFITNYFFKRISKVISVFTNMNKD